MSASTPATAPARGRLGHRTLQLVQCVDVGRLQAHPVWLRSGSLVAVTGLGPTDSNETSKTTWMAAATLLTGDHGWDVASGTAGQHAARLLFDPPDGDGAARAEHGYVVGVFGPDEATLGVGEGGHLTVWLRVNRSAPFLQFRLAPGVLVARGESHPERIADADRLWSQLPGQPTLGPKQYLHEVLGDLPRSTGYVSDRGGKPARRASLLTSPLADLSPAEIGDELVDLAGLRPRLRAERDGRRAAAEAAERLAGAEHRLEEERERVRAQLDQISARADALAAVDEAAALRDAYLAAQTRDLLEARRGLAGRARRLREADATARLAADLERARAEVDELADPEELRARTEAARATADAREAEVAPRRQQRDRLAARLAQIDEDLGDEALRVADEHQGRDRDAVAGDHERAGQQAAEARVEQRQAAERLARAEERLRRIAAGEPADEVALLQDAGLEATVLGDAVEPAAAARDWWDAALAPWREALIVADDDLEAALAALADRPGTLLVHGATDEEAPLPGGITAAPGPARRWLRRLADSAGAAGDAEDGGEGAPAGAAADAGPAGAPAARVLGELAVVGGYPDPQTGRDARHRAAQAARDDAREHAERQEREAARREAERDALGAELAAAEAHERREALRERRRGLLEEQQALTDELAPLERALADAERDRDELAGRLALRDEHRQAVETRLEGLRARWATEVEAPLDDLAAQAREQNLPWWVARLRAVEARESSEHEPAAGDGAALDALELDDAVSTAVAADAERVLQRHDATGRRTESLRRRYQESLATGLEHLGVRTSTEADGTVAVHAGTDVPETVRRRVRERAEAQDGATAARVAAFDALVADLRDVYGPMVEQDELRRDQIQRRLAERERDVDAAAEEHASQLANAQHLQSSLEDMVRTRLDGLGRAFAAQVAADDGAAAELRVTPVIPGDGEHDRTLRFEVVPRWSRKPGGALVDYRKPANLAQLKLKAVQLLLAALRADDDPAGRLLVLDELGANLGDRHREWVLRGLATVARRDGVTVLATVQDDLQSEAFRHVDEVLVFRYRGQGNELNEPTSMLAAGPDDRLRPVAELLEDGWPQALAPALDDAAAYRPERADGPPTIWDVPDHVPDGLTDPGTDDDSPGGPR